MLPFLAMAWAYVGFALFFAFVREPGDLARRLLYGRGGRTPGSRRVLSIFVALAVAAYTAWAASTMLR